MDTTVLLVEWWGVINGDKTVTEKHAWKGVACSDGDRELKNIMKMGVHNIFFLYRVSY